MIVKVGVIIPRNTLDVSWGGGSGNGAICNCLFVSQGSSLGLLLPRHLYNNRTLFFCGSNNVVQDWAKNN